MDTKLSATDEEEAVDIHQRLQEYSGGYDFLACKKINCDSPDITAYGRMAEVWRKCSSCKKPIFTGALYYTCSVSTCNSKSAPNQFCRFECWSVHNEIYRHRSGAAIEEKAPAHPDRVLAAEITKPVLSQSDRIQKPEARSPGKEANMDKQTGTTDILVVASKVKKYIQENSGLNTSADVMQPLTDLIVQACNAAVDRAKLDGRKTVMARDIKLDRDA